jgi:competence protein ComEC
MAAGWESRRRAADSLSSGIEHAPHAVAVLRAMVLGYRSELPYELRSLFANSGTVHIFAISGLHVGILAALLTAVLPLSRIPRPHWGWVLGPALILYTHISGASPSAMRACVMSLLFFAGPLLGRKPDALSALSAAAIGLLAVDPLQLAQLGFLFSFACVIALLTLSPLLRRFCQPRERDESTAFDDLVHRAMLASGTVVETVDAPPAKHRSLCWLRGVATASLSVSLAAWVASAPLTALYFGRLTPIAILGNLFAIPLATGIVLCGSLSLVGGLITPWLSVTFNCAALALVELLIRLTRQTVMLPGAVFAVEPWPPWVVLLWYLAALGLTVLLRLHLRRRAQAATMLSPRP